MKVPFAAPDCGDEEINEVIDFIGCIKSKDPRGTRRDQKRDAFDTRDNVLLSIVGIGESAAPHDLAQIHEDVIFRGNKWGQEENLC